MRAHIKNKAHARTRQRGSALLITMIFSAVLLVGLASVFDLMLQDLRLTSRTSAQEAAFSLAESGIEEGIWSVQEFGREASDWTNAGWTIDNSGKYYSKSWNLNSISGSSGNTYSLDEGRVGTFKVIVEKTDGAQISLVAQGTVTGGDNVPTDFKVSRVVEAVIEYQNPLEYGLLTGEGGVDLSGKPGMASYDSRLAPFKPSDTNNSSEVKVGSTDEDKESVDTGGTVVQGDLFTGDPNSSNYFDGSYTGEVVWGFETSFPAVSPPDTKQGTWITTQP